MMNKLDNNEMNMNEINDIDLIEPSIEFVECMGNDDTVVNAARVSFGKESNNFTKEQNDKLIAYLAKHKHWSPFAHPQITFRTKFGLPIARQLAKHHVGGVVNECFSDDTEVLTKEGWKFWNTVNENDELATPEIDGSSYSFEKPIELICNDYEGDMYHIYSRDLDMCVTPNHDQYISYYVGGKWADYKKYTTQEAVKLYFAKTMKMPSLNLPEGDDYWEGKLYGAFLGDGSISNDQKRIYFHVKKERKKEMLRELSEHTEEFNWNENLQEDGYSYFRIRNIFGWNGKTNDKEISFYKNTKSFMRGIYDGLVETDGHVSKKNSTTFSTTSKSMCKTLEKLGWILGFDLHMNVRKKIGNWNETYKFTFKYTRPKLLKYYKIIHYSGKVYCARTRTGLLIVRRNGKSCVSGNCSRRYRDDNIQFENIDIFRTRPKNVKQGSDINSVVENNEEIKELYKNFLKTGEKLYQYFIKCGVCPEQSRYVLPQAMITEWYWTGSLYYFARVCKDRLSPLAQLETRKIAEQISECLQKQFPVSWNALMQNRDKME